MIQKREKLQDLPSDDDLIGYLEMNQYLFVDFVSEAWPYAVVNSENITVIKYLMKIFPELNLQLRINEAVQSRNLNMIKYF